MALHKTYILLGYTGRKNEEGGIGLLIGGRLISFLHEAIEEGCLEDKQEAFQRGWNLAHC